MTTAIRIKTAMLTLGAVALLIGAQPASAGQGTGVGSNGSCPGNSSGDLWDDITQDDINACKQKPSTREFQQFQQETQFCLQGIVQCFLSVQPVCVVACQCVCFSAGGRGTIHPNE